MKHPISIGNKDDGSGNEWLLLIDSEEDVVIGVNDVDNKEEIFDDEKFCGRMSTRSNWINIYTTTWTNCRK